MSRNITKFIPALICWGVFIYVVLQVPYPETITQANANQLLSFFIPLFLSITLMLNLILKNIFISTSISLGIIFLLFLKALESLNLVTAILILIPVGLIISYFKKIKKKNLTSWRKIPKLTHLRKRNMSS